MDIDYLLSLQEFRNGVGGILSDFFSKMTFLGELNTALVVMAILYWSVHKELGTFLLMGFGGNPFALVMVTHSSEAAAQCDRTLHLENGKLA